MQDTSQIPNSHFLPAKVLDRDSQEIASGAASLVFPNRGTFLLETGELQDILEQQAKFVQIGTFPVLEISRFAFCAAEHAYAGGPHYHFQIS